MYGMSKESGVRTSQRVHTCCLHSWQTLRRLEGIVWDMVISNDSNNQEDKIMEEEYAPTSNVDPPPMAANFEAPRTIGRAETDDEASCNDEYLGVGAVRAQSKLPVVPQCPPQPQPVSTRSPSPPFPFIHRHPDYFLTESDTLRKRNMCTTRALEERFCIMIPQKCLSSRSQRAIYNHKDPSIVENTTPSCAIPISAPDMYPNNAHSRFPPPPPELSHPGPIGFVPEPH
ncbi:hypothetical protein B0H13DRAFT_1853813 [Mycena leptocephala]|nr:hypothetical protein B0H13DRAFT_1853813 [Mycena leptocephala]